jgi:hypothetical protein
MVAMGKRSLTFVISVLSLLLPVGEVHAGIIATLNADNASYSGICPVDINFKGTITTDKPGKVQYRFVRSDGVIHPVETLEFNTPGTKEVTATWIACDPVKARYEGWQSINIVYPEELQSNKANFSVTCDQTTPDLAVRIKQCPKTIKPGHELGQAIKVVAINRSELDIKDVGVELVLKREPSCPVPTPAAVYSPHYSSGVLLKGGREQVSLVGGQKQEVKLNGPNMIPSDVPAGDYFLCAVIDAGDKIKESNEANNCSCCPIKIFGGAGKPDLIIEKFSFKGWGKCEPNSPIFTFEVTVANIGVAPSPAITDKALVQVMDLHGTGWGNAVGLNSIPPGGKQMVVIPVYYLNEDPTHMTKVVPHPFRAVVDPHHLVDESNENNNKSDIIYLDPGLVCSKVSGIRSRTGASLTKYEWEDASAGALAQLP